VSEPSMLIVTEVAPYLDGPAGVHGVLGQAATALAQLASLQMLQARVVTDVGTLTPEDLADATVVALFTIGETRFDPEQRSALTRSWAEGRTRLLGIHSATDACYGWEEYAELFGARFDGHPWTQTFDIEVVNPDHPATRHLGPRWRWHDEVYLFGPMNPHTQVLLRVADGQLDMNADGARTPEHGFPLAWCRTEGPARSFYCALGHFPGAWESTAFLRHLDGALAWLLDARDPAPRNEGPVRG
jgi:type 1 glutamine amidotransferase